MSSHPFDPDHLIDTPATTVGPLAERTDVEPTGEPDGDLELIERSSVRRNLAQMASARIVAWTLATVIAVIATRYLGPGILGRLQDEAGTVTPLPSTPTDRSLLRVRS